LLDELIADARGGHNVRATVYMECQSMYRAGGPQHLRCVGETEFVNGIAAMTASGTYGDLRACAAIVGSTDLRLGDRVQEVLEAHLRAGGGRFRGIRQLGAYDADVSREYSTPGLYLDPVFRSGFQYLGKLGLSFDAWVFEPQLADVIDLAQAFPNTSIILNHAGTPLGIGVYQGRRSERFPVWADNIRKLARCENVSVKLGGLGIPLLGFASFMADPPAHSRTLADEWRPYVETCVDAFGPKRCMFESNYPADIGTARYAVIWNAFKRIAAPYSAEEKKALFSGTAAAVYQLDVQ
jgi:L-fuconolactonase